MSNFYFPRPVVVDENGCWFVVTQSGPKKGKIVDGPKRPKVTWEGEKWGGHRLSYHLNKGNIPCRPAGGKRAKEGLVLHTCDVGCCVNPAHLYLGTPRQNIEDVLERNPEARRKNSESQKGRAPTKGFTGGKHSEEARKKMSESSKRYWAARHRICEDNRRGRWVAADEQEARND